MALRKGLGFGTANLYGFVRITVYPWERVAPAAPRRRLHRKGGAAAKRPKGQGEKDILIRACSAQLGLRAPRGFSMEHFFKWGPFAAKHSSEQGQHELAPLALWIQQLKLPTTESQSLDFTVCEPRSCGIGRHAFGSCLHGPVTQERISCTTLAPCPSVSVRFPPLRMYPSFS